MSRRTEKIGDLVQVVLSDLVRLRAKDPDLHDAIFSFAGVEVSPDMAHANVRVSVFGDDATKGAVLAALVRSEPFLHREMARELHMRRVPRLSFILDESIEEADRMTTLMREVAHAEGREF
jgi:ribosome-binding factor A